ncbi:hypothetical protein ACFV9E_27665 [Streptomyces sp. NPDC059835]|uniref:hypothetical protein n=1 Tax=Streptomyces sp. NPDC059835 TaxID=3346967 RepID=UPI0036669B2D
MTRPVRRGAPRTRTSTRTRTRTRERLVTAVREAFVNRGLDVPGTCGPASADHPAGIVTRMEADRGVNG